jgi:Lrp/AsnC family transcriptional regulator, leucine-responsive regulatory protein
MDDLDYRIIKALQSNGRVKKTTLARELNVPTTTLVERIRRLEKNKVITEYQANIDPQKLDLLVQAFISVSLDHHQKSRIRDIENDIQKIPYVRACYHVAGRFDYLLHITAKDVNHLGELVKKEIAAIEGIGKIETFIIFSEAKVDRGWPIPNNANSEDKSNVN